MKYEKVSLSQNVQEEVHDTSENPARCMYSQGLPNGKASIYEPLLKIKNCYNNENEEHGRLFLSQEIFVEFFLLSHNDLVDDAKLLMTFDRIRILCQLIRNQLPEHKAPSV